MLLSLGPLTKLLLLERVITLLLLLARQQRCV
jgi:hypothetical protein